MSIVVTCSCTRTYRLPDRYAGKRCRCRDCGKKIEVPTESEAEAEAHAPARARRSKGARRSRGSRKDDPSRTTRRLSSQDQEILGERRRLRSSHRARPISRSESMHQLAPMTLSGDLPIAPPPKKKPAAAATKTVEPERKRKKDAPRTGRARKDRSEPTKSPASKGSKNPKASKGSRASKGTKAAQDKKKGKKKDRKAAKAAAPTTTRSSRAKGGSATKGKAEAEPRSARKTGKRGKVDARRVAAAQTGKRRSREDDDVAVRGGRKPAPYRLPVVIGIAGALCLGIGLVIGGLFASGKDGAVAPAVAARLAELDALKANRQWAAAEAEVTKLQAELEAAGDSDGLARLRAASTSIKKMAALAGIEDEETRVLNLVTYASDADPAVRLGVAHELRPLAEGSEDAQRALAALAADADARVAEAARHGLVQAGGPLAIPYLARTIEETAASGHKLGDVALERALELSDPAVVPVLVTALKHRASAPPKVLTAILSRLEEYGDPSVKDAVAPFTSNADEAVAAAARAVLESIGG